VAKGTRVTKAAIVVKPTQGATEATAVTKEVGKEMVEETLLPETLEDEILGKKKKEQLTERSAAIIGTRNPDADQILIARDAAKWCNAKQLRVRTGAALGIDMVAMTYATKLTVVLPWASYNRNIIPPHAEVLVYDPSKHDPWTESVARLHPAPLALTRGAISLHARNYGIVEPVSVVFALPDERGEGGTGQGIRVAKSLGIPVIEYRKGSGKKFEEPKELGF
jgi:hypothetical protein